MRIALVITELDPGGAERCLARLAVFLHQRGHDVRVLAFGPEPISGQKIVTDIMDSGGVKWETAGLGPSSGISQMVRGAKAVRWLRRKLREFAPDVVQSMLFHADCIAALALPSDCRIFVGGARVSDPSRGRAFAHKLACRKMQRVVCVSQSVAEHLVSVEGIAPQKLMVIPNGIGIPSLNPSESSIWLQETVGKRVLLSVGRLFPQKGYARYLRGIAPLMESLPEHHVAIVGEGPEREELQRVIAQLPCRDRVHLLGWRADAADLMQGAEALVLPSEYEGMPNAILECMAAAKPFVAFEVDGVRELVADLKYAELQTAPPRDHEALHQHIIRLAEDASLREACGEDNRTLARSVFSLDKHFEKYEAEYQRLLELR
jgi:glycosyltransferase involved in cell wall biosynthesis